MLVSVCVCVCVRERERESECVCVFVCVLENAMKLLMIIANWSIYKIDPEPINCNNINLVKLISKAK